MSLNFTTTILTAPRLIATCPPPLPRKDLSEATWHWADNMGEVTHPKANLWTHTGVMRDSKLMCFVEEAL